MKNRSVSYLKILPLVGVITLFTVYPTIFAINVSLKEYILTFPSPYSFIGLENYRNVLGESYFIQALVNTMWFTASCVICVSTLGFFVALLLNQNFKGVGILKVLIFLPWTIPYIAVGILWKLIFMSEWGYLTKMLRLFGILETGESIAWLTIPAVARVAVIIAQVWHELPLAALFILAGIQTIPNELYEALEVDGGGMWHKMRYITIPLLKPIFTIVIVLNSLMAMITFDVVYVMTGGGPAGKTSLLSYYGYTKAFRFLNFGEGGAISILITLITIVLVLTLFKIFMDKTKKTTYAKEKI